MPGWVIRPCAGRIDIHRQVRHIYEPATMLVRTKGDNIGVRNMTRETQSWYELGTGFPEVIREIDVGGIRHLLLQHVCVHITERVETDGEIDGNTRALRCRYRTFKAQRNREGREICGLGCLWKCIARVRNECG